MQFDALKPNDVVLVVRASRHPHLPKPGAMGTVVTVCSCFASDVTLALTGCDIYQVDFGPERVHCCPRWLLKKMEPPGTEDTVETPDEVSA